MRGSAPLMKGQDEARNASFQLRCRAECRETEGGGTGEPQRSHHKPPPVLDNLTPVCLYPKQGSAHKLGWHVRILALVYAAWAPALVLGKSQSPEDDASFATQQRQVLHGEPRGDFIWSRDGSDRDCYMFICMYIRKKSN